MRSSQRRAGLPPEHNPIDFSVSTRAGLQQATADYMSHAAQGRVHEPDDDDVSSCLSYDASEGVVVPHGASNGIDANTVTNYAYEQFDLSRPEVCQIILQRAREALERLRTTGTPLTCAEMTCVMIVMSHMAESIVYRGEVATFVTKEVGELLPHIYEATSNELRGHLDTFVSTTLTRVQGETRQALEQGIHNLSEQTRGEIERLAVLFDDKANKNEMELAIASAQHNMRNFLYTTLQQHAANNETRLIETQTAFSNWVQEAMTKAAAQAVSYTNAALMQYNAELEAKNAAEEMRRQAAVDETIARTEQRVTTRAIDLTNTVSEVARNAARRSHEMSVDLAKQLSDLNVTTSHLQTEMAQLNASVAVGNQTTAGLKTRIEISERKCDAALSACRQLEERIKDCPSDGSIHALRAQIEAAERQVDSTYQALNTLKQANAKKDVDVSTLDGKVNALRASVERMKAASPARAVSAQPDAQQIRNVVVPQVNAAVRTELQSQLAAHKDANAALAAQLADTKRELHAQAATMRTVSERQRKADEKQATDVARLSAQVEEMRALLTRREEATTAQFKELKSMLQAQMNAAASPPPRRPGGGQERGDAAAVAVRDSKRQKSAAKPEASRRAATTSRRQTPPSSDFSTSTDDDDVSDDDSDRTERDGDGSDDGSTASSAFDQKLVPTIKLSSITKSGHIAERLFESVPSFPAHDAPKLQREKRRDKIAEHMKALFNPPTFLREERALTKKWSDHMDIHTKAYADSIATVRRRDNGGITFPEYQKHCCPHVFRLLATHDHYLAKAAFSAMNQILVGLANEADQSDHLVFTKAAYAHALKKAEKAEKHTVETLAASVAEARKREKRDKKPKTEQVTDGDKSARGRGKDAKAKKADAASAAPKPSSGGAEESA